MITHDWGLKQIKSELKLAKEFQEIFVSTATAYLETIKLYGPLNQRC